MILRGVVATILGLLAAGPGLLAAGNLSTEIDGLRVELASEPVRPGTEGLTTYRLPGSRPSRATRVVGAKVTLQGRMGDGMTVVAPLRTGPEPGIYRGRVLFAMEGRWDLTLRVTGKGKPFELTLTEDVGR